MKYATAKVRQLTEMPSVDATTISDKARAIRWRSESLDVISLRQMELSRPA